MNRQNKVLSKKFKPFTMGKWLTRRVTGLLILLILNKLEWLLDQTKPIVKMLVDACDVDGV